MCVRPMSEKHDLTDYSKARPPAFPASLLQQKIPAGIAGADRIGATLQQAAMRAENAELREFVEVLLAELCLAQSKAAIGAIAAIGERLEAMKRLLPLNDGREVRRELDALVDDISTWLCLRRVE